MTQDLFIPVAIPTTKTETVGVTLRELSIARADASTPGVFAVALGSLDEDGNWRHDVTLPPLLRRDDLSADPATDPQARFAASMFQELIFSAIVSDTPQHRALGIAGLTVWDAAKVLLPGIIGGGQ